MGDGRRSGEDVLDVLAGQIVVAPGGVPHRLVSSGPERLRSVNIQPVARMVADWITDDRPDRS